MSLRHPDLSFVTRTHTRVRRRRRTRARVCMRTVCPCVCTQCLSLSICTLVEQGAQAITFYITGVRLGIRGLQTEGLPGRLIVYYVPEGRPSSLTAFGLPSLGSNWSQTRWFPLPLRFPMHDLFIRTTMPTSTCDVSGPVVCLDGDFRTIFGLGPHGNN